MEKIGEGMEQRFNREKGILETFCRAEGLHHSAKREAVLEELLEAEHHITAETLWQRLQKRKVNVDPKTVGAALELMVGAGLAQEIRLEDGTVVYEHALAHRHHDHLICRRCGNMIEFSSSAIEHLQDEIAAEHHFIVENHVLSLYGICKTCADKAKVAPSPRLTEKERAQLTPLDKLKPGQIGVVREIRGGGGVARRLSALGIRPGKELTKVSAMFMGGPVVLSIDRRQLALGNGMAGKVLVEAKKR